MKTNLQFTFTQEELYLLRIAITHLKEYDDTTAFRSLKFKLSKTTEE